ncbi:hypothetical protein Gogos_020984 [Gossypium gossypioides]|uniref:BED-type domain-containing protein n=1 Tax=Gossypium gossypioides TaxID=34282 RepID=A0A7J9D1Q5_GOSGO|nr:hypothetical protein [Gossypium gossypioides]
MARSNTPINVDDRFNEYENVSKRQKSTTSNVWGEMTKLECENKNELKAQCNHCKSIFSAKYSIGTSHLRRHLNNYLKKINKDITQYTIATQPSLGGDSSIKTYKFDANECRRAVSTFLVCSKHSFRIVEDPRFVSSNFKNISRQTTTRDVLMYYAKERDHVKEELAKAHGLICLTSNNWNSEHTNDEYICIIAYWVDKDAHALDFVQTILSNLKLLFEEYVNNSKSMFSSLAGSSNVSDNDHVDSSLHQLNVNSVDLGGDYDESDDYRRYLSESSTKSERSQLDIYLEEPELELNSQIDVLDY